MAVLVLDDARTYLGGYNLTGFSNKIELTHSAEVLDSTVFGESTKSKVSGLKEVKFSLEGYWDSDGTDDVDDVIEAKFATANEVITISPDGAAAGDVGFSFKSLIAQYVRGGSVGELIAFTVNADGTDVLVRGTIVENGVKTSTANGTARELGAVGAAQKLYASLHVIAVSGTDPTLDVTIQSDDAEGFLSGTTRITFAQKTAIGSEWATPVAGEITDTWWRAVYTISGTNPSFTIVIFVGIQ